MMVVTGARLKRRASARNRTGGHGRPWPAAAPPRRLARKDTAMAMHSTESAPPLGSTETMRRLSIQDSIRYRTDGFLVARGVVDAALVEELRANGDALLHPERRDLPA